MVSYAFKTFVVVAVASRYSTCVSASQEHIVITRDMLVYKVNMHPDPLPREQEIQRNQNVKNWHDSYAAFRDPDQQASILKEYEEGVRGLPFGLVWSYLADTQSPKKIT